MGGATNATQRMSRSQLTNECTDVVYDGAFALGSISDKFGTCGGPYSSAMKYHNAFQSRTPRPWQRSPSRNALNLDPGQYCDQTGGFSHSLTTSSGSHMWGPNLNRSSTRSPPDANSVSFAHLRKTRS